MSAVGRKNKKERVATVLADSSSEATKTKTEKRKRKEEGTTGKEEGEEEEDKWREGDGEKTEEEAANKRTNVERMGGKGGVERGPLRVGERKAQKAGVARDARAHACSDGKKTATHKGNQLMKKRQREKERELYKRKKQCAMNNHSSTLKR